MPQSNLWTSIQLIVFHLECSILCMCSTFPDWVAPNNALPTVTCSDTKLYVYLSSLLPSKLQILPAVKWYICYEVCMSSALFNWNQVLMRSLRNKTHFQWAQMRDFIMSWPQVRQNLYLFLVKKILRCMIWHVRDTSIHFVNFESAQW